MSAPVPAAATPSTGAGGSKLETPEDLDLDPNERLEVPAEAIRLHEYLISQSAMQEEYHKQRPWFFAVSKIRLVNEGDSPLSLFLNLVGKMHAMYW